MARSFQRLLVGLKAISQRVEEICHYAMTHLVPHVIQFLSQVPNALRGPPQGRLRIPTLCRIDELLQILLQCRIGIDRLLAAPARQPDVTVTSSWWSFELFDTPADGLSRHARAPRCARDSPGPNRLGLCSRYQAPGP